MAKRKLEPFVSQQRKFITSDKDCYIKDECTMHHRKGGIPSKRGECLHKTSKADSRRQVLSATLLMVLK